jgi:hypothetical protein
MGMWHAYFGPDCHVYGVDIEPACRAYASERTEIFIGDQGDPAFWRDFVEKVLLIDLVVDDGSHRTPDQIVTLEALLPRIRPGGVYLCEDVHGPTNEFHDYIDGFARNLHSLGTGVETYKRDPDPFQRAVHSVHLYPFVVVIEMRADELDVIEAPKHGTEWEPFYA